MENGLIKNGLITLVYDDALVCRIEKNKIRMCEDWRKQCIREEKRDKHTGNLVLWKDESGKQRITNEYRRKLPDNVMFLAFPNYLEFRVSRMFEDVHTTPYQKMMRAFMYATRAGILWYGGAWGLDSRNCKEAQRHKLNRAAKLARFERDVMFINDEVGSVFYGEIRALYGAYRNENTVYVRQSKDTCSIKVYNDERFLLFGDEAKIKLEISVMTKYLREQNAQTPKLWHTVIPETVSKFMDSKLNGVLQQTPEARKLLSARLGCRERDISTRVFAVENTLSYVVKQQEILKKQRVIDSMRIEKLFVKTVGII